MFILYLVGGLGETYPHTSRKGAGMIYIQSFFYHGGGRYIADTKHRKTPTQLINKAWGGEQTAQGTPTEREVFCLRQKMVVWASAGEQQAREEIREQRQDESRQAWGGPNLAQPHADKTRGENTRHRTGTKHSRRRTERTGRQAPLPTDRIGAGRRTLNRGGQESNAHTRTAKARRQAIVADSREGEQKVNQLLAKTRFCE